MQLRYLKTFVAVAATLNFTRAGEQVHLAQSSVSDQLQALEAELGTPLFDRSRRKLALTPAGERLLAYAQNLLDLADEARSAVSSAAGTVTGRLAIGGLETLCSTRLPALLAGFRKSHPAVEVTLRSQNSGELRGGVTSGALDACFVFGTVVETPELRCEKVAEEEIVIIAPPNHRLAGREIIAPDDLAEEAFLVTESGCVYRRMFETAFAAMLPARPRLVGEFASIGAIGKLVEAGLGCALVPRLVAPQAGTDSGVVILPWMGQDRFAPVTMIWRRRRVQSPALRAFLSTAREGRESS